jgi:hypothetical protein
MREAFEWGFMAPTWSFTRGVRLATWSGVCEEADDTVATEGRRGELHHRARRSLVLV